jgi:DNA-directed RNA polymerase specialized sigma24 family protein
MDNEDSGSITRWLSDLNGNDESKGRAQQELWDRYFARLSGLARKRMPPNTRRAADEEDIALSALNSFFRRAGAGQFPNLTDRTGLWPLLARITAFKAMQRIEHERAAKRGGDKVVRECDLESSGTELPTLEDIISSEPTPEFASLMDEQVQLLLRKLDEQVLREIAQLKLEGYQNGEIAELLGIGKRTVERKLARIRSLWAESVG